MSQIRLVVREAAGDWSGTVEMSVVDCAVAALSADPTNLTELNAARARYASQNRRDSLLSMLTPGLCDEPCDEGIAIIDLVAKLVVVDASDFEPLSHGEVCYEDAESTDEVWLPFHLADDWQISTERTGWKALADSRRQANAATPGIDARPVVYGLPLLEFVGRRVFESHAESGAADRADSDVVYDLLKQIHADWLLMPREDLNGSCPRDVMLASRDHISMDLQNQGMHWSRLDKAPPVLDRASFAFRYGGFGTHELVKYYDLVRELLPSCWSQCVHFHSADSGSSTMSVGDFLTAEIPRLASVRDAWFDEPDLECHGRTPRSIIDRERARIPETVSGREAMVDEDCPCCQMLADMPGPVFWHLDGCNMDDEFVFSIYHRRREEWDEEQRRWAEHNDRFNAEMDERERLGLPRYGGDSKSGSIWSSTCSVGDIAELPLGIRLFGIGCRLAEVITGIRRESDATQSGDSQEMIDRLNRDFGNLRELLLQSAPSLAEALIVPVIDRFSEYLGVVGAYRPEMAERCDALSEELATFLNPQNLEIESDPLDPDDFGSPF